MLSVFQVVMEALAVPVSERSDCVKPDTASVKVIVASNGPFCTPDGTSIVTVGLSTSTVTVCEVAAVFGLFAASVATLAATPSVTVPLIVGVIVAV